MGISSLKGHLLRLRVPGFPFFISILSSCFDLTSFINLFLSSASLFDNTDSTIYQECKKCMKQGCFCIYGNKGHSEGRMF